MVENKTVHKRINLLDSDNIIINPATEDKQDTLIATDFATETTLALIQAKTNNLDTALSGIKTGTDKIISAPATESKQDDIITQQIDGTQQTKIKETIPTDTTKNNGSFVYTYDASGNLTQIDQIIGAITYRKTLTYDASNNLTAVSVWSIV